MLGMPLRALSWNMTFAILARGAGGAYLAIETASAVFYLCMNLVLFSTCGFAGANDCEYKISNFFAFSEE